MGETTWPPQDWVTLVNLLGPYNNKFFDGLIPLMDVRQFIYDFARELVDWIPHQPPEHKRVVNGLVRAPFSSGAKSVVPIGKVGYNAQTHQVLWEVNRLGSSVARDMKMTLDVQAVIPTVFQLLMMIPWDFVGDLEVAAMKGDNRGTDKAPRAKDIVKWIYGELRNGLSEAGIQLPQLPGDYSSVTMAPDIGSPPRMTARVMNLTDAGTYAVQDVVFVNNLTATGVPGALGQFDLEVENTTAADASIPAGDYTFTSSGGVTYRSNVSVALTVPAGATVVLPFLAQSEVTDTAQASLSTELGDFVIDSISGDFVIASLVIVREGRTPIAGTTKTLLAGEYGYSEGGVSWVINVPADTQLVLRGGTYTAFDVVARTIGRSTTLKNGGQITNFSGDYLVPPPGVTVYSSNVLNGTDAWQGASVTIPKGSYRYKEELFYEAKLGEDLVVSDGQTSDSLSFKAALVGKRDSVGHSALIADGVEFLDPRRFTPLLPAGVRLVLDDVDLGSDPEKPDEPSVFPSIGNLALYNIPVINFCQTIYDSAVALVEAMPHHPPEFTRAVNVGGCIVRFEYEVQDTGGKTVLVSSTMPGVDDLRGNKLIVKALFYDGEYRPIENGEARVLLEHHFLNEHTTIDFASVSAAPDEFFKDLPEVALNLEDAKNDVTNYKQKTDAQAAKAIAAVATVDAAEEAHDNALRAAILADPEADPESDPSVIDAKENLTTAKKKSSLEFEILRVMLERLEVLESRVTNSPERLKKAKLPAPAGLSLPAKKVTLTALTKGTDELKISHFAGFIEDVEYTDDVIIEATNTQFRLRIDVVRAGAITGGEREIPLSYSDYTPKIAVTPTAAFEGFKAFAQVPGKVEIDLDDYEITGIPDAYADWLEIEITSIENAGEDPPSGDAANDPGSAAGNKAELLVNIFNAAPNEVTADLSSPLSFNVNGTVFTVDTSKWRDIYGSEKLIKPSVISYSGVAEVAKTTLTDEPLAEARMLFSTPSFDIQTLARWRPQNEIEFVGEEFSVSDPFSASDPPEVVRRYIQARLEYKVFDDVDVVTGEPMVSKVARVVMTDDPQKLPHSTARLMEIRYDAVKRVVTVRNLKTGEYVEMRTSAVVWFMLALLLLLPWEVF